MTLQTLIPTMNFVVIKDFINQLLTEERNAQKIIAAASPNNLSSEEIRQQVDFKIYKDTFSVVDVENLPALSINIDGCEYPESGRYAPVGKYKENITVKIGCFALGVATDAKSSDSVPAYTADQNANMRLLYLISQTIGILCAASNWKKKAGTLIEIPSLIGWERIETPQSKNEAEIIVGVEVTFALRTTEKFEQAITRPLSQLYIDLGIDQGNIDPFINIVYN